MEYPEIDRYASLKSPIHQFDPRAKIITFSILIFSFVFVNNLTIAGMNLFFTFVLLLISRLPLNFVFNRIKWVFLFVLPFLIIMPFTVSGSELASIAGIKMTYEGFMYGSLIVLRAIAAVTLVLTMLGTMRFDTTIKALYMLKIPGLFIQMLMFTYRYIFVFLSDFLSMWKAMSSKGFKLRSNIYTLSILGNLIGMLIVKSYERAENVYHSMISKGYTGNQKTLVKFNMATKDYALTIVLIGIAILPHVCSMVI
ncbi:MAG TPA: cobalt ECF transporter T component CbiQ [Methanosarcinaceae archaeon]|nr:cobalt ECF transporter T component CbiQ [Methanosarcinaceae archaeon]